MRLAAAATVALLGCGAAFAAPPERTPYGARSEVRAFVRDLVARHGFVERELEFLFGRARRLEAALKAVGAARDPQSRSWRVYRQRFVNEQRIAEGVEFWRRHREPLERAAREHGVPEEIVVAILGVETAYGRQPGDYRVLDALVTLAFDFPPRREFFRAELEQYLLFARERGLDVFSVRGSYAGAIGIPQFMPGSYRRYAVDFDGDGSADLRSSVADAIGSVAYFLHAHGWRRGEVVLLPAHVTGTAHRAMLGAGIEPSFRLAQLRGFGVETRTGLPTDTPVALVDLETPNAPTEYRLGLRNFYVLTRYNRSAFYASAVNDLALALRKRGQEGGR
jgi:membrane-bound lytic murein transglycosylase B